MGKQKITDFINFPNNLKQAKSSSHILSLLESIGRLPDGFDGGCLVTLLRNDNADIRFLAVKNIGKLCNERYLECLVQVIKNEDNSLVRREAVSSVGRIRSRKAIPILVDILKDKDPKIVLQGIRALLVFRSSQEIQNELRKLKNHQNEIVASLIDNELYLNKDKAVSGKSHCSSPDFLKNVVVNGDVKEALRYIPNDSVHLTFTSPPYYNARDYSIYKSYNQYLAFLETVFQQIYRITKEGRFFLLNTSPVIIPRVSRSHSSKRYPIPFDIHPYLIKMGWEFIDDIIWSKPEASVKNRNAGFLQHRKPLAYKPNSITEYVMVYRKKTNKLIDWNIKQYSDKIINKSKIKDKYETSNVWEIGPSSDKIHTAVFPLELCKRVIQFYSYEGDLVFDPFAGRGTLGKAAIILKRYFFLTEHNAQYVDRMKELLNDELSLADKAMRVFSLKQFKEISKKGEK